MLDQVLIDNHHVVHYVRTLSAALFMEDQVALTSQLRRACKEEEVYETDKHRENRHRHPHSPKVMAMLLPVRSAEGAISALSHVLFVCRGQLTVSDQPFCRETFGGTFTTATTIVDAYRYKRLLTPYTSGACCLNKRDCHYIDLPIQTGAGV